MIKIKDKNVSPRDMAIHIIYTHLNILIEDESWINLPLAQDLSHQELNQVNKQLHKIKDKIYRSLTKKKA